VKQKSHDQNDDNQYVNHSFPPLSLKNPRGLGGIHLAANPPQVHYIHHAGFDWGGELSLSSLSARYSSTSSVASTYASIALFIYRVMLKFSLSAYDLVRSNRSCGSLSRKCFLPGESLIGLLVPARTRRESSTSTRRSITIRWLLLRHGLNTL